MVILSAHENKNDFAARLANYRAAHHGARPYDIAQSLDVSELQVLLHSADSMALTPLDASWSEIFDTIPSLGRCMALTRNDSTVSEVKGFYGAGKFHGHMGLIHHDSIDLRMFTSSWEYAIVVEHQKSSEVLRSLQIFDKHGKAVHKIYPQSLSEDDWENFVSKFKTRSIVSGDISAPLNTPKPRAASQLDVAALRKDWSELKDTHDFHGLLKKHDVERLAAFEAVGAEFARKVDVSKLVDLLQAARKAGITFMIFVGNSGMIQIRSGTIKETRTLGSWFNILDPDFNLHVNMQKLQSAWVVTKPSLSGTVVSLEVFDDQGDVAVTLFGYRSEGLRVDDRWATLIYDAIPQY